MKEFWNQRFSADFYVYGVEPNQFFKHQLDLLKPGKILLPAEGEGRNAVYAASKGWEVVACDWSEEGKKKAERLAALGNVTIDYRVADFGELNIATEHFDCIGLVFAHFPVEKRALFHQKVIKALKLGGTIILEGFSKKQLGNTSGGPKKPDLLFSEDDLRSDFQGLDTIEVTEQEILLEEGTFHEGIASTIRLIGKK